MSERPEEAIKWLKLFLWHKDNAKNISKTLLDYITQLEADSERLEELELALKEGDVAYVTASDMIEPGKWKHIEIEFDSDRNPVSRESLAEAIDEAIEEQN